ncbi:MAG: hypothetical protein U9R08_04580 [Nanoarchaeota archaeon]|nr:hypothetical protein [Nanoarchaeota archaeon]
MRKEVSTHTLIIISIFFVLIAIAVTISFLSEYNLDWNSVTGNVVGLAEVDVVCLVGISMPVNHINFGAVPQSYFDDTTDNNPEPMIIQNDGSIKVDVSIARDETSTALFSGTGGGDNTSSFQFKADYSNETGAFNYAESLTDWTYVPGTDGLIAITGLNYSDSYDSAEIDLKIQVPYNEPLGKKNETLNFIATASEGAICGDEDGSCRDKFTECAESCAPPDSNCYISCGQIFGSCVSVSCTDQLQTCKNDCTDANCRTACNVEFKECTSL